MNFFKRLLHAAKPIFAPDIQERYDEEVSRNLVPATVDSIMQQANSGDITEQCKLAREILEKNADIMQAVNTRNSAVLGCSWRIEPADDTPRSEAVAKALLDTLNLCGDGDELDTFEDLLEDMLNALLPGFAVSEIVWCNGGDIAGFRHIEQKRFTFIDSFTPKLVSREFPMGIELDRRRIVYHKLRFHGSDPARGGLIRPLAWLHCFKTVGEKDLLGFVERYGMPFIAAKVDAEAFDKERHLIKHLIRNFGSSGGGIFTRNVELDLLESSNSGFVYFRLLQYLEAAVNKVILGQTASSGEASGLSGGDAQSKVRQDILEADCRRLMRLVNSQIVKPWVLYNYGATEPVPQFVIDYMPPEDKVQLANTVKTLYDAGWVVDPDEISNRLGIQLRRRVVDNVHPTASVALSGEKQPDGLQQWLQPVYDQLLQLSGDDVSEDDFKAKLSEVCTGKELFGDAEEFEKALEEVCYDGIAAGVKKSRKGLKK